MVPGFTSKVGGDAFRAAGAAEMILVRVEVKPEPRGTVPVVT
jgi:hypothetical protein